jgi:hypothetical protein
MIVLFYNQEKGITTIKLGIGQIIHDMEIFKKNQ